MIAMAECICRICGKQFTAKNPRQIICSKECKKIANAEWSRTYYRKNQAIINERKRMHTERKHIEATQKPDTIVAIGYAERQIADTLKKAGRVKI
jgi:endogenous inhibitor of DNA gyrase (YacG/DUF329 family)